MIHVKSLLGLLGGIMGMRTNQSFIVQFLSLLLKQPGILTWIE
ncbi:hypothetical protein ACWN61_09575 [Weissella paramesenteroides]|uniref:Uncharacterized protein n=1 Tax=Weissella paramesenteroides ATCC 33313 TaxID=585506 RepID=C5RBL9_WEIPA|nr:hypothetical protein HMPREF0877_1365 [Weissella paramesenteroides ATCC 33313]